MCRRICRRCELLSTVRICRQRRRRAVARRSICRRRNHATLIRRDMLRTRGDECTELRCLLPGCDGLRKRRSSDLSDGTDGSWMIGSLKRDHSRQERLGVSDEGRHREGVVSKSCPRESAELSGCGGSELACDSIPAFKMCRQVAAGFNDLRKHVVCCERMQRTIARAAYFTRMIAMKRIP